MMVALLLYGYCQSERSSRVIEKRCVRDVAYRVITGGLRPDHATIARFRARHQQALGGLARRCDCWPPRAWWRWGS
jgi:transposase